MATNRIETLDPALIRPGTCTCVHSTYIHVSYEKRVFKQRHSIYVRIPYTYMYIIHLRMSTRMYTAGIVGASVISEKYM